MKRVLLVATVQSHIAQFHNPLIEMLNSKNVQIDVAARNNLTEKNGLKIENVNEIYDIPFSRSPISKINIKAYKKLEKLILENNYDIIHCNTPVGGLITRLVKKNNRNIKAKIIYTAHGFHFYKGCPLKNWLIYYPIERYFSKYTDALITINDEDYLIAKNKMYAKITKKINGVGIDIKNFKIDDIEGQNKIYQELKIREQETNFVSIGELNKNKNQIMQIKAMNEIVKKYPNTHLFMLGNGPLKEEYLEKIKQMNLEKNIKLLGYRRDIKNILAVVDSLISTSKREGLAVNILEGLASGKIVIASDNRGNRPAIKNGKTGFLITNKEELIDSMENVINNKEELKNRMKKEIENTIKEYSIEVVKKQLEEIYMSEVIWDQ